MTMPLKISSTVEPRDGGPVTKDDITANDVLSGRGGFVNSHGGNVKFRELVLGLLPVYYAESTKKLDKAKIGARIIGEVRAMDPPGRFLREDPDSHLWFEIGDERAGKKVGQAFRDLGPNGQLGPKVLDLVLDQEEPAGPANRSNDVPKPSNDVFPKTAQPRPVVPPLVSTKYERLVESKAKSTINGWSDGGCEMQEFSRCPTIAVSPHRENEPTKLENVVFPPMKSAVMGDKDELRKALDLMQERARNWEDLYYREREYSRRLEDRIVSLLGEQHQPPKKKRKEEQSNHPGQTIARFA